VVVVVAVLATSWSPVIAGHPAYLITLLVVAAGGLAAIVVATVTRRPASPRDASTGGGGRSRGRTWALWITRVGATLAVVALVGVLWWLRPLGATSVALDALQSGNGVVVEQSATRIELRPTGEPDPTGLIFYPGAKVDARAYAAVLRPIAEAGHVVVIVKLPFGVALIDVNAASSVIDAEPDVAQWVVAGHSLGGTAAARFASQHPDDVAGLVLWASYPAGSLADDDLAVLSVSGTEDGLTTPADVEDSRADLPPDTEFVAVEGAVHAQFGDYGPQSGDGTPTVSRAEAQRQITAATLAFLDQLDRAARPGAAAR
jgi:hypothetical protein